VKVLFTEYAWEDYLHWQKNDAKLLRRINELIREIQRTPFNGIGKPEPLRGNLSASWSRRINGEHRIVYKIKDDCVHISQCRYHY